MQAMQMPGGFPSFLKIWWLSASPFAFSVRDTNSLEKLFGRGQADHRRSDLGYGMPIPVCRRWNLVLTCSRCLDPSLCYRPAARY